MTNIIVFHDFIHRGYAHTLAESWFQSKQCLIISLRFLQNNMEQIQKYINNSNTKTANIVFFDSIFQPLYESINELSNLFDKDNTKIIRIKTHTIDEHLQQSHKDLKIDHTVSLIDMDSITMTLPRDSKIWNSTENIRKQQSFNIKPKFLPILAGRGMGRDLKYLQMVAKYPFRHINEHWDNQVISVISSFGCVGIATHQVAEHNQLRRFWHTYGITVLEDAENGLKLPQDSQIIPFTRLLGNKHNLMAAKRTNINLHIDLETQQRKWCELMLSVKPTDLFVVSTTANTNDSNLIILNKKQQSTSVSTNIPKAKLIVDDKDESIARLPLFEIEPHLLPTVSICTLTRDHRLVFPFVVNSIRHQSYPLDKIEWIILQNGDEDIKDLIPPSMIRQLKRFHIETIPSDHGKSISELRNMIVSLANEPYVAFMDDDDIYFHTCLLARIKTLIKYNKDCVGSTEIGNYDLLQEKGSVASDGSHVFSEASMAFRKSFWEERGFNVKEKSGEAHGFLLGRHNRCIAIPYHFNMISLSHSMNTTGTLRMIEGKEMHPLKKIMSEEELSMLETTSKYLRQRYRIVKQGAEQNTTRNGGADGFRKRKPKKRRR